MHHVYLEHSFYVKKCSYVRQNYKLNFLFKNNYLSMQSKIRQMIENQCIKNSYDQKKLQNFLIIEIENNITNTKKKISLAFSQQSMQQLSDIFQVSITSNKLISVLQRLEENYLLLETKIIKIDALCKQEDNKINFKLQSLQQNMKTIIQDQINKIKIEMQSDTRQYMAKLINENIQKQEKINQVRYSVQTLNAKINEKHSECKTEIQNLQSQLTNANNQVKKLEIFVTASIQGLKDQNEKEEDDIYEEIEKIHSKINTNNQFLKELKEEMDKHPEEIKFMTIKEKFMKFNHQKHYQTKEPKLAVDQLNYKQSMKKKEKAKNKLNQNSNVSSQVNFDAIPQNNQNHSNEQMNMRTNTLQNISDPKAISAISNKDRRSKRESSSVTLQYASVVSKIEIIQKKVEEIILNSTQSKATKQPFARESSFKLMKQERSANLQSKITGKQINEQKSVENQINSEMLSKILSRIEVIQTSSVSKQHQMKKLIQETKQKTITNIQKIDYSKVKITRASFDIAQLKTKIQTLQKKLKETTQVSGIQHMQSQIGKIIQRLDNQFEEMLKIEQFQSQKQKIYHNFKLIHDNLFFKSEKQEVKKAITFLQIKIKQIILVLSKDLNDNQAGSITKVSSKCLTCDKQAPALKQQTFDLTLNTRFKLSSSKSSRNSTKKYMSRITKQSQTKDKQNCFMKTKQRGVCLTQANQPTQTC